jgi:hypothetical protein
VSREAPKINKEVESPDYTKMSRQTRENLWRVMLDNAREHDRDESSAYRFLRRRSAFDPSVWIPLALMGVLILVLLISRCS